MASVNQLLDTFTSVIDQLVQLAADKRNNVVIGGSCALSLMGVKMGREPEDLDVIVYEPSADQLKFIQMFDLVYQRTVSKIDVGSLVTIIKPNDVWTQGRCAVVEAFNPLVENQVLVRFSRQGKLTLSVCDLRLADKHDYAQHLTLFDRYKLDCDDVYFSDDSDDTDTAAIWEYKRKNGNKVNFVIKSSPCPVLPVTVLLNSQGVKRLIPVQSFNIIFAAKLAYGRYKDTDDISRVISLNLTKSPTT